MWNIINMCGTGGCQDFLRWANLSNGIMPRTGDLVIMASLASASLATFGMTAIVSGKNRLKDQGSYKNGEDPAH